MAQILDQHHDILVCSQCQKYLSVFPVKVYEEGSVKCGRCCRNDNGGVPSLYEELAKHCLFKCVNRYEGCRKLLLSSEVTEHETTCVGGSYSCPSCEVNSEMSAYHLIQHFKTSHTNWFVKNNIFKLTLSKELNNEKFLCVQDDNIFIIFLRYIPNDSNLYITAVTLIELEEVTQQFIISVDALSFMKKTAQQKCISLDNFNNDHYDKLDVRDILNQLVEFEIVLKVSSSIRSNEVTSVNQIKNHSNIHTILEAQTHRLLLTPEFRERYPDYNLTKCGKILLSNKDKKRLKLTCSNCKMILRCGMNTCASKKHLLCCRCKKWCSLCEYSLPDNKESMIRDLLVSCKWNCGIMKNSWTSENHEYNCNMNKRKCPICWVNLVFWDLSDHMKTAHQCLFDIFEFNLVRFLQRNRDMIEVEEYFHLHQVIFKIKCMKNEFVETTNNEEAGIFSSRSVYTLHIIPCDNMDCLELCVIVGQECRPLENGRFTVTLEDKPELYLKYCST